MDTRPQPAPFAKYVHDPVGFMRDVRGFEPWSKQAEIAEDLANPEGFRQVVAYTCNGAGKSTLASELILWFMASRRNARVITTAGTGGQVRLLWRKIRSAYETSRRELPGPSPLTQQWNLSPEWFALGLSTNDETTLQGHHALIGRDVEDGYGDLLAVIDEASAVEDWVFNAMRGYMNVGRCYWLVLGNPNRPDGEFFQVSQRGNWHRHSISAFDVPFIDPAWIDDQRKYWGEDSAQYQVRVLGEFPRVGGDFLIFPLSSFEAAADEHPDVEGMHIGADIARGQGDANTLVLTVNGRVEDAQSWRNRDLMETAARIAEYAKQRDVPWQNVHIDVIGLGAGVVDRLREQGYNVEGVDFGARPVGDWTEVIGSEVKVQNRRSELYWAARCALDQGLASVPEAFRRTIWRECNLIQYEFSGNGQLRVEAKEKIRSRMEGRSPDFADAWVLSFSRGSSRRVPFFI